MRNYYSIKDLENLTGVKAHTIRIWEKRYEVVSPTRSNSNIRSYDDAQMRTLLNISLLVNNGFRISQVAKMSVEERNVEIDNLLDSSIHKNIYADAAINRLLSACLIYDEIGFNRTYEDVVRRYGLKDAYIEVLYPLLIRIGLMWSRFDLIPAQEHFISNLLRQKFFSAINNIETPENAETWVLFLPDHETHEIGLLFCYFLLKESGKKVIYLGQNVPYANLKNVVDLTDPDCLYFFLVKHLDTDKTKAYLQNILKDFGHIKICVSGNSIVEKNAKLYGAEIHYLNSVQQLENVINKAV